MVSARNSNALSVVLELWKSIIYSCLMVNERPQKLLGNNQLCGYVNSNLFKFDELTLNLTLNRLSLRVAHRCSKVLGQKSLFIFYLKNYFDAIKIQLKDEFFRKSNLPLFAQMIFIVSFLVETIRNKNLFFTFMFYSLFYLQFHLEQNTEHPIINWKNIWSIKMHFFK